MARYPAKIHGGIAQVELDRRREKSSMLMAVTEPAAQPAARGPAEIDLELFTFVERYATNLVRWDIVLFFGKNPETDWTAEEIAARLNRGRLATTKELDDLTYLRVLVRRYTPERTSYRLSKRASIRRSAMQLANLEFKPPLNTVA